MALVLSVPLLILLVLAAAVTGGLVSARLDVDAAARQAARAAGAARDPGTALTAARSAAETALASGRTGCAGRALSVGVGALQPGGAVTVTVTCRVRLADVAMAHVPGGTDITSAFAVPVHSWRAR
ncbi:TadE/TadG family type IV pilus assembly protein [Planomonospora corallina]|uniref:TadE/TadG family type IV pilus assembly protein n=1 Tax=Planomonospora corallina TaxID=1806052 RepID=A0ABV8IA29_9ACTN